MIIFGVNLINNPLELIERQLSTLYSVWLTRQPNYARTTASPRAIDLIIVINIKVIKNKFLINLIMPDCYLLHSVNAHPFIIEA